MQHASRFAWVLACLLACKGSDSSSSDTTERVLPTVSHADRPSAGLPELVLDEQVRFESKTLSGDPAELQNALAEAKPKGLLLTAEPDFAWITLRPNLGAAAAAGVERVEISVRSKGGENGVLPIALVAKQPETEAETANLRVAVWEQGYTITVGSDDRPGPDSRPTIPLDGSGRLDTAALAAKIGEFVRVAKGEKTLVIWASPGIALTDLVATIEAVRGPECRGPDYFDCHFAQPGVDVREQDDIPVEAPIAAPQPMAAPDVGSTGLLGMSRVSVGEPTVTGSLEVSVVKRIARAHASKLRACYDERAKEVPGIVGGLTIEFTIAADGTVSKASPAKDSTIDEVLSTCMTDVFKEMRFPKPDGGTVEASIPLALGGGLPQPG